MRETIVRLLGYMECHYCNKLFSSGKRVYILETNSRAKISLNCVYFCEDHAPYFDVMLGECTWYQKAPALISEYNEKTGAYFGVVEKEDVVNWAVKNRKV